MFEQIKEIIEQYTTLSADQITPDSRLLDDLNLNSLDVVNMVVAFEDTFDIEVPDEDISGFLTVKDIEEYLENRIGD